jgi:glycosyltransferase involved in cell wall biosynthesis
LITPARDEAAFVARTIQSVASQSVRPVRWVIVNDGSTDRTREIVESRAEALDFIRVINLPTGPRNFARKALAFAQGLSSLGDLEYDFIGNLDADIALQPDYYEQMLGEFGRNPRLGIAGGVIYTRIGERFLTSDESEHSVAGAVQLFRKECFRAVGGYVPLEHGGIDAVAEIKARMLGWEVRKFLGHKVFEQRRTGTAQAGALTARVREGRRFHSLGYGLMFYLLRSAYRIMDPPVIIGSLAALYGYLGSYLRRAPIAVPADVAAYSRTEQQERLRTLRRKISPRRAFASTEIER